MPRTQKDLFLASLEKIGGEKGKLLRAQFEQQALPHLQKNENWDVEIPDDEFEEKLKQIEKEIPAFLEFLSSNQFPPPPKEWKTEN